VVADELDFARKSSSQGKTGHMTQRGKK
jgi:hypothetical protein